MQKKVASACFDVAYAVSAQIIHRATAIHTYMIHYTVHYTIHTPPAAWASVPTWRLLRPIFYTIVPRRLFFYCSTMNSHRPKSQVTSKEQALNPEKELRRTWPRCHVSLEKSSKNHKPLEKWAKPNLSPDVTPRPANLYGEYFPRICQVVKPDPPELCAVLTRHSGWPK